MNDTNDPKLRSFVDVAADSHFPIQNLPYGMFVRPGIADARAGVAIGDWVLDLAVLDEAGLLTLPSFGGMRPFHQSVGELNDFMSLGPVAWREARQTISHLLRADSATLRDDVTLRAKALVPQSEVRMVLPVRIGDYTDFYSSREHATNVGTMFRGPENALMPNWLHVPIAYHGRASSIVISGTDLRRPCGQTKDPSDTSPQFGPSKELDFELEMGFFIGTPSPLGEPIPVTDSLNHVFGMVLVNDWSARDIQRWEYQPLGPFLAKNFGTSISPWIVTLEALEPWRCAGPEQNPAPLPYLRTTGPQAYDIRLAVKLQTEPAGAPQVICQSNSRYLYWNVAQQLAHHTVNGCNVCPGDLMASGTISGPTADSYGSMLELAWKGTKPITIASGQTRVFLEDGDRVTMTAWCEGDAYRVGFGEVTGAILPAIET